MRTIIPAALLLAACWFAPATSAGDEEPAPKKDAAKDAPLPAEHPLRKDKTGMRWTLPFKAALAKATQAKRILMIKPVAFGTSPDGGW